MCFHDRFYRVFTLPDFDAYVDPNSRTENVTMEPNGMAPRCMLNGYITSNNLEIGVNVEVLVKRF